MSYVLAQYSTPSAVEMIRGWLNNDHSDVSIEIVAKYMSKTLRIGGIKVCRSMVRDAITKAA